jgi:glycosyltransferase involved in cell wall biosynthesis
VMGEKARIIVAPDLAAPAGNITAGPITKKPGELSVAFLSRVSPIKNLDGALRMLAAVRQRVTFDIYGPIEDSHYWDACQALIKALPAHITATYRGTVEHDAVARTLAGHDLFFLPSRGESFGYAIVEALAAGCPVLISDRTPWRNLNERGAGWALPLDDEDRFVAVLEELALADRDVLNQMRARAVSYYAQESSSAEAVERSRALLTMTV